MKTSKSPENAEVTPSKKKLKQARLPFKLISEGSATPVTPPTRKRKLSETENESATKLGKICKENDIKEDTVTISDDEDSDVKQAKNNSGKPLNPFVKLVDTAWKKKLQKSKKKKSERKTSSLTNGSVDSGSEDNVSKKKDEVEQMDIDVPSEKDDNICDESIGDTSEKKHVKKPSKRSRSKRNISKASKVTPTSDSKSKETKADPDPVVVLEDSNNSDDKKEAKCNSVLKSSITTVDDEKKTEKIKSDDKENVNKDVDNETVKNERDKLHIKQTENSDKTNSIEIKDDQKTEEADDKESKLVVTPKRSTRNKDKGAEKNVNISVSKLDDSITSSPKTPKNNKSLSATNSLDDSMNDSTVSLSKLTPKQLQKRLEINKRKEEKEKEKQERDKKKQLEKDDKAKQRTEKEELKKKEREEKEEAKRKEKEEKEEQRRKEKEEKDKQRELEKKLKEEKEEQKRKEREEKEEQKKKEKEARDEEKRKKQEAMELQKQEDELKKKKAAEAFANFFVPKQKSEKDQTNFNFVSKSTVLSSFTIKSDMRLAPIVRVDLSEESKQVLDKSLEKQNASKIGLYLKMLKKTKPLTSGKTWPITDKNDDDDVMIVEDELPPVEGNAGEILSDNVAAREKLRPKLLSFHDNRRPPYWGTWRKKSTTIKPRNPLGQDQKHLDYEVDSDDDWEEEQEGESLDGSAAGSDDEPDDDYEVDNDVFVPHGYLSDEEATMDEEDNDVLSMSPETQKARLKHLENEFETEMKKPTEKLKPRLYGLLWETKDGGKPENCVDALWNYFGKFAMIMNDPKELLNPTPVSEDVEKKKVKKKKVVPEGENQSPKSEKKKKAKPENKESKSKNDTKKSATENKKNQPGINTFLTKLKTS